METRSVRMFAAFGRPCKETSIGVPKETFAGENRVALSPEATERLAKLGLQINIESGAGEKARFRDEDYKKAGANIVHNAYDSDITFKVRPPTQAEVGHLHHGNGLISMIHPAQNQELVNSLNAKEITSYGMDQIPRLSRAQTYDVLSSMSNISGYKAVIEAASHFGRFFTGQMTAAGRLPPAKVLIIGGGVAGLSAGATAKSLGAIVRIFDTRAAVREQAKSLGADFLEVKIKESGEGAGGYAKEMSKEFYDAEMELFMKQAKEVDIIITTALIPGREAPKLITKDHIHAMKPGSVVVDLAAEAGGNCAYTKHGEVNEVNGVKVIGYSDFPSQMAGAASSLYANNISKFMQQILVKEDATSTNLTDDVARGAIVTD